jgi:hypothetical protein
MTGSLYADMTSRQQSKPLDEVREALCLHRYSIRSERPYVDWIKAVTLSLQLLQDRLALINVLRVACTIEHEMMPGNLKAVALESSIRDADAYRGNLESIRTPDLKTYPPELTL